MNIFIHDSEIKILKKLNNDYERRFLFGFGFNDNEAVIRQQRKRLNEDNRKWAYITIADTRKMVWVDNKTMKAYKSNGYEPTWIEIKKFTFERWCTPFDL